MFTPPNGCNGFCCTLGWKVKHLLLARNPPNLQMPAEVVSQDLSKRYLPWISGSVLAGCAVFSYSGQNYVLIGLMLLLPLLDRAWRMPALPHSISHYLAWAGLLLLAAVAVLTWRPSEIPFALATLLTATQTRHPSVC